MNNFMYYEYFQSDIWLGRKKRSSSVLNKQKTLNRTNKKDRNCKS